MKSKSLNQQHRKNPLHRFCWIARSYEHEGHSSRESHYFAKKNGLVGFLSYHCKLFDRENEGLYDTEENFDEARRKYIKMMLGGNK